MLAAILVYFMVVSCYRSRYFKFGFEMWLAYSPSPPHHLLSLLACTAN